jgi:hypothetical protein
MVVTYRDGEATIVSSYQVNELSLLAPQLQCLALAGIRRVVARLFCNTKQMSCDYASPFEKKVLRRIFGHRREEVAGDSRRLHNEKLHNVYTSPNIIRVINSRRVKWMEHVARVGR